MPTTPREPLTAGKYRYNIALGVLCIVMGVATGIGMYALGAEPEQQTMMIIGAVGTGLTFSAFGAFVIVGTVKQGRRG